MVNKSVNKSTTNEEKKNISSKNNSVKTKNEKKSVKKRAKKVVVSSNNNDNNKKNSAKNESVKKPVKKRAKKEVVSSNDNIVKKEVVSSSNENVKNESVKKPVKKRAKKAVVSSNNDNSVKNEKKNKKNDEKKNAKINFNEILKSCVKNIDYSNAKDIDVKALEEEYNLSFDDINTFRKSLTKSDVDDIDTIIYHDENNDGMIACAIAYHYLKELGKTDITLVPTKPGKPIPDNLIRDKNVLLVDIESKENNLKQIKENAKSLLVIDDHYETFKDDHIFNGTNHAACAYTWKFFYPKLDVPQVIQFIDDSDAKLFLKHIPRRYSHFFNHGLGFRYSHNKTPLMQAKKRDGRLFDELWYIVTESVPNFWITIGFYYDQVTDNLKEQIAINARPATFQGYKVGVLNFNSPALSKPVGRQMITNFRNKGIPIDFVVLWGYEYTSNGYRIQLMDDHSNSAKIDLSNIARQLGKIGGHPKGGGGHFHDGNFYWPHNNQHDIWELFNKNFL